MSPRVITKAALVIACLQTASWADGRIFLVPLGGDEGHSQSGVNFSVAISDSQAQSELIVTAYVEVFQHELVKGAMVTAPCSVACSVSGSIDFVPIPQVSPGIDQHHEDYIFDGWLGATFPATDTGDCGNPNSPPDSGNPRAAIAISYGDPGPYIPELVGRKYFAQFKYAISPDCIGVANFVLQNEPFCAIRNDFNQPIPFTTDGLEVWVNYGQCCADGRCLGVTNGQNCSELGLTWTPGLGCEEDGPCVCVTNAPCVDTDACRCNRCVDGECTTTSTRYADVDCNGLLNADDLLCWVAGFSHYENCPNGDIDGCTRDGTIDIDDAVELISAWYGSNPCGCVP